MARALALAASAPLRLELPEARALLVLGAALVLICAERALPFAL